MRTRCVHCECVRQLNEVGLCKVCFAMFEKWRIHAERVAALDELVALDQEMGLYD